MAGHIEPQTGTGEDEVADRADGRAGGQDSLWGQFSSIARVWVGNSC